MRFHFHVTYGNDLEYDCEGQDFLSLEVARQSAINAIRTFFLLHPNPEPRTLVQSVVCIARSDGDIMAQIPFPEAFRTAEGWPVIHCSPGEA